jgi:ABC-type sugar transport system permease subunit
MAKASGVKTETIFARERNKGSRLPPRRQGWRQFARRTKLNGGLFFVLPAVGIYLFYVAWPILSIFQYSLYKWDGLSPDRTFVGLDNYVALFTDDRAFRMSIQNNLIWAVLTIGALIVVGFLVSYLLNQQLRLRNLYRVAFFLPTTASLVVIGYVWKYIYDNQVGPLNAFLRAIGLEQLTRTWLADPQITLYAVIVVAIWAALGFSVVVYLAAIQSISLDLFESSSMDGANGWQQMIHLAVPLTMPTTRALAILGLIGAVNQFGFVFLLSEGGPYHASEVMAYQIYDLAFKLNQTGYASALSVVLLLISAIVTVIQLSFIRNRSRAAG